MLMRLSLNGISNDPNHKNNATYHKGNDVERIECGGFSTDEKVGA